MKLIPGWRRHYSDTRLSQGIYVSVTLIDRFGTPRAWKTERHCPAVYGEMETNGCPPLPAVMDLRLDAICVVDTQGRYVYVSAAFERIFGYAPEEALGRPMIELVHPDDRALTLQAADEIMRGQAKPGFQNRYLRKDGRIVHIMWSARWSEADRVRIAVAHDITELKRAEAVQAALLAISEAAHTAKDLLALFQRIHQIIDGLLPARNCYVALYDEREDELSFPYYCALHRPGPIQAGQ